MWWWVNHHDPPSTRLFMLNSTHHPGVRLIDQVKYLESCMPQWQVSSLSTVGFHQWPLIEIFYRVFNFKSFIHTWEDVLRYLGHHWHQWWSPLHLLTLSIWLVIKWFRPCLTSRYCNHMVRFVSLWVQLEDPGLSDIFPRLWWSLFESYDTDTLCIFHGCVIISSSIYVCV